MINGLPSWTMSTAVEAFFNKCLAGNLRNISFWMLQRSRRNYGVPVEVGESDGLACSYHDFCDGARDAVWLFTHLRVHITQAKNAKLLSAEDRWRTIEAEWEAAVENDPIARAPKIGSDRVGRYLLEILRAQSTDLADTESIDAMKVLSYPARESVAAAMITILSKSNRRDKIVEVLARYCPLTIGYYDGIEYFLAYEAQETLPKGVTLLFDAYSASDEPEIKARIATALRNGFLPLGVQDGSDDLVVANCRAWYAAHHDEVIANIDYINNSGPDPPPAGERVGLFIEKPTFAHILAIPCIVGAGILAVTLFVWYVIALAAQRIGAYARRHWPRGNTPAQLGRQCFLAAELIESRASEEVTQEKGRKRDITDRGRKKGHHWL